MVSIKVAIFHVLAWMESAFALNTYYQVTTVRKSTYGGDWKFLTYINMNIQFVCFSFCILNDFLEIVKLESLASKMRKVRELFYASFAFPACVFVFLSFWALYAVDRELVFPKHLDKYIPHWVNHVWHSAILITVIEVTCRRHRYPKRSIGIPASLSWAFGYLAWIMWIRAQSGISVYPFLELLSGVWFVLFAIVATFFSILIYLFGEYLNNITGADSGPDERKKK